MEEKYGLVKDSRVTLKKCDSCVEKESKKAIIKEASYLLFEMNEKGCPQWELGVGDCGKPECWFCRVQKCVDALDDMEI